jgi:hypothetical protein
MVRYNDEYIEANIFYCSKCMKAIVQDLDGNTIFIGYTNEAKDEYCSYQEKDLRVKDFY